MKWLVGIVAALVLLAIVAVIALPYLVDLPRVQALIATNASQALGRPVTFASMRISALPLPAVELRGLEIGEDPAFGKEPFVRLQRGTVRLKLWPLLQGRVELGRVTLQQPVITLIQAPDGRLNIASLGGAEEPSASKAPGGGAGAGAAGAGVVLGTKVEIEDGVVQYVARGKGDAATRYRAEDLDLALTGGPSQVAFEGGLAVRPGELTVKIAGGSLGIGGAKTIADAPLRGTVTLAGKDIGDLVRTFVASPELGGSLGGTLTLGGTLAAPTAGGDVKVAKPTVTQVQASCAEPKRRTLALGDLALKTAYKGSVLTARPVTTSIGNGTITAQLTASLERGVRVQLGTPAWLGRRDVVKGDVFFCTMGPVEVRSVSIEGDGGSLPDRAILDGLRVPIEGTYDLINVLVRSNGDLRLIMDEASRAVAAPRRSAREAVLTE